jgi:hypothetical protein
MIGNQKQGAFQKKTRGTPQNFNDLRVDDIPQRLCAKESFMPYQCVNLDISFSEIFEAQKDILMDDPNHQDATEIVKKVGKSFNYRFKPYGL